MMDSRMKPREEKRYLEIIGWKGRAGRADPMGGKGNRRCCINRSLFLTAGDIVEELIDTLGNVFVIFVS